MRLATWNVNSVRIRLDRIANWLERNDIDVLAMQETKIDDARFPVMPLAALGYEVATHGVSQWNGVAVASRVGLEDVRLGFPGQPGWGDPPAPEARALGASCGGVRVWSLYVPNGRAIGDPHLDYKIAWLDALRAHGTAELAADPTARIALCGDFNIAPTDDDVWDPAVFVGSTHVTPAERAAYQALVAAGFTDLVRPFTPGLGVYTYWDYQQLRFARREGMRIDFVLGSPALADRVTSAWIDREERKGKAPSDHVPVVVEFDGELAP
jgi:exodeoxyribonuclease-3